MVEVEPLVRCKLASFSSALNFQKTGIAGIIPEVSKEALTSWPEPISKT